MREKHFIDSSSNDRNHNLEKWWWDVVKVAIQNLELGIELTNIPSIWCRMKGKRNRFRNRLYRTHNQRIPNDFMIDANITFHLKSVLFSIFFRLLFIVPKPSYFLSCLHIHLSFLDYVSLRLELMHNNNNTLCSTDDCPQKKISAYKRIISMVMD